MQIENLTPPDIGRFQKASGVSKRAATHWKDYCRDCNRRAHMIVDRVRQFGNPYPEASSILDWGSAAGGVAIVIQGMLPEASLFAGDLDKHSMDWLSETVPKIDTRVLYPKRPLPFEDDSFDVVYGISVFTHISLADHDHYLGELRRVVKPGGLVLLTFHGYHACDHNLANNKSSATHPTSREFLKEQGLIHIVYSRKVMEEIDFVGDGEYGVTYHSPEFLKRKFGEYFDVLEVEEGALGSQDLVVLRK